MDYNRDSIKEQFLGVGDLFGMKFNDGLVFLEVIGAEYNQVKPFTGVGSVASDSSSGFTRLEVDGDDILYIEDATEKVLHAGIGQRPSSIRRYTNYPEGQTRLRTLPNLSVPTSRTGADYGYVDGYDSPYEEPTDVEELVIPPLTHLDFDFFNPNQNEAKTPVLNIEVMEYNVNPLPFRESSGAIRKIMQPGSPVPIYPAGGLDNQIDFPNKLQNNWGVTPVRRNNINLD